MLYRTSPIMCLPLKYLPVILFTMVLIFSGSKAIAQNQTHQKSNVLSENAIAIAAAMNALDEFMLAFNAQDPVSWARSLNYPHVRFAGGTVTIWQSAAELSKTDAFERLAKIGWDHSHWLTRDVTMASTTKVHILTKFQRFDSHNIPIATYQSLYIVTKVDGHWGIQSRSSFAP